MIINKTLTQEKSTIFVSLLIILSVNFEFLKIFLFPLFSVDSLTAISFLIILFLLLEGALLVICFRYTIKPLLIILLIFSSVFSYTVNNFDLMFEQTLSNQSFHLDLINFKSFLYLIFLGLLPSLLLVKINLISPPLKSIFLKRLKLLLIFTLIFVLLIFSIERSVNFPLKKNNPIVIQIVNLGKAAIPLKNFVLGRDIDYKMIQIKIKGSCAFCNLSKANFNQLDLNRVDLRFAILAGANLRNADLSNANLEGADLTNSALNETILSFANLTNAKLDGVDLSNKDLNGTIFTNVDFSKVDLKNINLSGSILNNVDFSNNDLTGTILSFSNLIGSNLDGVELNNKDLTRASLNNLNLSNKDLSNTVLNFANLSGTNLDGVKLSNKYLNGTIFNNVDFSKVDLTKKNLSGAVLKNAILKNKDLTNTILSHSNLSGANLDGVDLRNKDLTGTVLKNVDLSNKDLTGTILAFADLSGANLDGANLLNSDLNNSILSEVDLRNVELKNAKLENSKKIKIKINNPSLSNWPSIKEVQNLNVTRYDLRGNIEYLTTKKGLLYEFKDNESRLVLDLSNDNQFPFFANDGSENGLLGVASNNNFVYISYTNLDEDGTNSLLVDEYSMNFKKVRNIIKIKEFESVHFGGNLLFDSIGRLYLSVGDGSKDNEAQNLNSLKGKILRLNTTEGIKDPEIIAFGLRNPWGVTIDSSDRMFILQCGEYDSESVFLLSDLNSDIPMNLGWPDYEGSLKKKTTSLSYDEVLRPIFEYRNRPGCATAGVYLDDIDSFLFADFFGTIRLIKQQENDLWYLLHQDNTEKEPIWGFGFDKKTKKIFIAPDNRELEIVLKSDLIFQ